MPILKRKSTKKEATPVKVKPYALDHQKKKEYKTKGVIGIGTYGVVREAVHIPTGRTVALKIIKKHVIKEHHKEGMVERELSILKKIKHPHIVEFIDYFETKSKYYIVFELATGGELFDRICQKGKFTEKDAAIIITTVIGAVSFLHSRGIIHRDIKPENLLYRDKSPNSDLLLCDFGISKMIESPEEMLTTVCGSPGYTAPEILKHEPYSKPVDMWSIGVITYTLLCGYSPFHYADDLNQLYSAICHGRFTFDNIYWAYISRYAKDFIKSLLQVNPDKRLTAEEALQHTWLVKLCPAQIERIKNINGLPLPSYSKLKRPIKSYSTSAAQGGSPFNEPIKAANTRVKTYVKSKYLITDDPTKSSNILHQNSYISYNQNSPGSDDDKSLYPGTLQSHNTIDVTHYASGNSSTTLVNKTSIVSQTSTTSAVTTTASINQPNENDGKEQNTSSEKVTNNNLSVSTKPQKDQYLSPSSNISDTSSTIVQSNSINSNVSATTSIYSDPSTVVTYSSSQKTNSIVNANDTSSNSNSITNKTLTNASPTKNQRKSITPTEISIEKLSPKPVLEHHSPSSTTTKPMLKSNPSLPNKEGSSPNLSVHPLYDISPDYKHHSAPVSANHSQKSSPILTQGNPSNSNIKKHNSNRSESFLNHLFKKKNHSSHSLNSIPDHSQNESHQASIPPRTDSKNQTINKHTWKTLLKSTKQGNSLFRRSKENLKSGLRSFQKSKNTATKSLNDLEHSSFDGESYEYSTLTDTSSITLPEKANSSVTSDISRSSSIQSNKGKKKLKKKASKSKLYTQKSFSTPATSSSLTALIKTYQNQLDHHNNFLTIPNMEIIEKKYNTFENNDNLRKINDLKMTKINQERDQDLTLESFPPFQMKKDKGKESMDKVSPPTSQKSSQPQSPTSLSEDIDDYDYIDELDLFYTMKAEQEKGKKKSKKKNVKCRSKLIFSGSKGWYPENPVVSIVKENGEIKGYYPANEKNNHSSRSRNSSSFEKKVLKDGAYYNTKSSKKPIPSIILTERTETNSSTSSLIPSLHYLKDFSQKYRHKIAEEDELNTDISEDNDDYDDLDIPLVKSKPLSSTPLDDIEIGPHDLEKIAISNEILSQQQKTSTLFKTDGSNPPKKSLKPKESYDLLDDIMVDMNMKKTVSPSSSSSFSTSKPIDIKIDKGKDYHSPNIVIQPSTPVSPTTKPTLSKYGNMNSTGVSNTNPKPIPSSSLAPTISTISPSSDISTVSSLTTNVHHKTSTKKLNQVGRRGAFYDHKNDPDLLSISIPSTLSQSLSSNTSESLSNVSINSSLLSTFNYHSFSQSPTTRPLNDLPRSNNPGVNPEAPSTSQLSTNEIDHNSSHPKTGHSKSPLMTSVSSTSAIDSLAFASTSHLGPNSVLNMNPHPVSGLTIGTNMYVEPDQISTSMSSSAEEDFDDDSYQYSFNQPSYSLEVPEREKEEEEEEEEDPTALALLPDEHYIANFSANGVKPQIPSFEREDDEKEGKVKIKRARAKSDSRCVLNEERGMNVIQEEGDEDGLLHPSGFANQHKRMSSTGAFEHLDKKTFSEDYYEDDLEMPNLLSEDLYSKVLRKKFQRAVRLIKIVRRLSSRSSVSSSSFTYNNTNDVSDTSSFYSNTNPLTLTKLDPKTTNTLSVGTHSRTSSIGSSLSNMPTPSIASEVLVLTPSSTTPKEEVSPEVKSMTNIKPTIPDLPISPALSVSPLEEDTKTVETEAKEVPSKEVTTAKEVTVEQENQKEVK